MKIKQIKAPKGTERYEVTLKDKNGIFAFEGEDVYKDGKFYGVRYDVRYKEGNFDEKEIEQLIKEVRSYRIDAILRKNELSEPEPPAVGFDSIYSE